MARKPTLTKAEIKAQTKDLTVVLKGNRAALKELDKSRKSAEGELTKAQKEAEKAVNAAAKNYEKTIKSLDKQAKAAADGIAKVEAKLASLAEPAEA